MTLLSAVSIEDGPSLSRPSPSPPSTHRGSHTYLQPSSSICHNQLWTPGSKTCCEICTSCGSTAMVNTAPLSVALLGYAASYSMQYCASADAQWQACMHNVMHVACAVGMPMSF